LTRTRHGEAKMSPRSMILVVVITPNIRRNERASTPLLPSASEVPHAARFAEVGLAGCHRFHAATFASVLASLEKRQCRLATGAVLDFAETWSGGHIRIV
jgi:hypothetical protein